MTSARLYLAGPEVFFSDALAIGKRKVDICARYGLVGVYPLDASLDLTGLKPCQAGLAISEANVGLMRSCQGAIANLSPFRGAGCDPGTAAEVGFMSGLNRPVFSYTNNPDDYIVRVFEADEDAWVKDDNLGVDGLGLTIEDFGLADNLMLEGFSVGGIQRPAGDAMHDLSTFEDCVRRAAEHFSGTPSAAAFPALDGMAECLSAAS